MTNKNCKSRMPGCSYPAGLEPDVCIEEGNCRHLLGHLNCERPLVALLCNPSIASANVCDRTARMVAKTSQILLQDDGKPYDGWAIVNLYPERATNRANLSKYNQLYVDENIKTQLNIMGEYDITEIWGAWGDVKNYEQLIKGRDSLFNVLLKKDIKIFALTPLNKDGSPRHPSRTKISTQKKYLDYKNYISA